MKKGIDKIKQAESILNRKGDGNNQKKTFKQPDFKI